MPRLDGMDGSHYQPDAGPVDLNVLAAAPTFWWAWKATQSTSGRDPSFSKMWAAAQPLFVQKLAYHWLSSTTDPVLQADHFMSVWDHTGGAMLDAEEAGITEAGALAWCDRVEATTKRPCVVYSGLYVAGGTIWKSAKLRWGKYGPRPFIVAAYVSEANLAARLKATNSPPPHAWQYSSNGPVPGITGRCDMDMVHDRAAFDFACGLTAKPPVPTPPPQGDPDMADFYFTDGTPSTWMLMPDGTKRGLGYPVEYGLRGVGSAAAPIHTLTPAEVAQIPDYVPPADVVITGHLVADLGAGGHITGSIG